MHAAAYWSLNSLRRWLTAAIGDAARIQLDTLRLRLTSSERVSVSCPARSVSGSPAVTLVSLTDVHWWLTAKSHGTDGVHSRLAPRPCAQRWSQPTCICARSATSSASATDDFEVFGADER